MRRPRITHAGQATLEGILSIGLLVFPAMAMAGWLFRADWAKTKCVYQSYQQARQSLLQSGESVRFELRCGEVHEVLTLHPLETLDLDPGGLDLDDYRTTASQFWERFSSWRLRLSDLASSASEAVSNNLSTDKSP